MSGEALAPNILVIVHFLYNNIKHKTLKNWENRFHFQLNNIFVNVTLPPEMSRMDTFWDFEMFAA